MNRRLLKASELALLLALLPLLEPRAAAQVAETVKEKQEDGKRRAMLKKTHFANGNQAMQDAQAIRQQLQTAANDQKPALLTKMKSDYEMAITEYQLALQDAEVRDENGVVVVGLLRVIRNGLVSQQKAVDMLVQDKELPVILSNLGMAYGGAGEYQEAITVLQQAAILKPAAGTYMELGTDLAQVGRMQEATTACDKIPEVDSAARNAQASCYKNLAIVLTNQGKLTAAIAPLQKATQLNPQDASAWKLLGDTLSSAISSKSEDGKIVYVILPGTIEAYQRYLQLEPSGPYAGQVKSAMEGLALLAKGVPTPTQTKEKN